MVAMVNTLLRRLPALALMLWIVSIAIFSLTHLTPGDPASAVAGETASVETIERIREELGLNDPFGAQYVDWISGVVQGDLGESLRTGRPVVEMLADRAPATFSLAVASICIAIVVGVGFGVLSATKLGSVRDRASVVAASVAIAVPNYWLGMLLVTLVAVQLRLLPPTGYVPFGENPVEWARHLALPAAALGLSAAAELTRQTRASLGQTLQADYVRTAEMKGLPRSRIIGKHAMKNAAGPVVTTIGIQLTVLLGGAVIVEQIFSIPGLGHLAIEAVSSRDLPVIQGVTLLMTVVTVAVHLSVDLMYSYINPKLRV